jgi:diketogulonate reductase-like aldo/keto reductase
LSSDPDVVTKNVIHAIMNVGYRHIDTAAFYENEEAIGKALKHCFKEGIKREDLFIVRFYSLSKVNLEI